MILTSIPIFQKFHIEGINHISPDDAYVAVTNGDAILIDVREAYETVLERINIPVVYYHPMSVILDRLKFIPDDKLIIIACPRGERSAKVVNLLNREGFSRVANLDGGLELWKVKSYPYTISDLNAESHDCCSTPKKSDDETSSENCGCSSCDC